MAFSPLITSLVFAVLLLFLSPAYGAATCVNSTTNSTLLPEICQPVLPYTFFYDADLLAVPAIQQALAGIVEIAQIVRGVVPRECATQLVGFYCASFFPECSEVGLPRAPCAGMCASMNAACTGPLTAIFADKPGIAASLLPNCSALESDPFRVGVPKYPNTAQLWTLQPGVAVNVTCLAAEVTSRVHVNFPVYSPWVQYSVNDTQDIGLRTSA
jgi:hypothetical protein